MKAVKFELDYPDLYIEDRGKGKWAVCYHRMVLDKYLFQFTYEPMPSSRTDEFLEKHRFNSAEEANEAFLQYRKRNPLI